MPPKWQFFPGETIAMASRPLRAFHDATLGSELLQGKPVICHNDPGPNNVVFQDGQPAAFIDFDMMAT
jgi:Ser/Thr protein kinase RdoA (MazF antagonist)